MKYSILFFCLSISAFAAEDPRSGSSSSGAFSCEGRESTEFLDLWEGRALDQLTINESLENMWDQAAHAAMRLREMHPNMADRVEVELLVFRDRFVFLSPNVTIAPPSDSNGIYERPGCPVKGLMYYDNARNRLSVDRGLFTRLASETERGAALFHEALYKVLREDPAVEADNTISTRHITSCLFSENPKTCMKFLPRGELIGPAGDRFLCKISDWGAELSMVVTPEVEFESGQKKWNVFLVLNRLQDVAVPNATTFFMKFSSMPFSIPLKGTMGSGSWNFSGLSKFGVNSFGFGIRSFNFFSGSSSLMNGPSREDLINGAGNLSAYIESQLAPNAKESQMVCTPSRI